VTTGDVAIEAERQLQDRRRPRGDRSFHLAHAYLIPSGVVVCASGQLTRSSVICVDLDTRVQDSFS